MEKFLYWRHCHEEKCPVHIFAYLNLIRDGIHNFIDGMIIAASFILSYDLGIVATDLLPELHKKYHAKESIIQLAAILTGLGLMSALKILSA